MNIHNHTSSEQTSIKSFWRRPVGIALLMAILILAFYALREHGGHIFGYWPYCWESLKTDPEFSSKTDPPCYCINYSVSVDKLSFFVSESPFLFDFLLVCFLLDSLCLNRQDSFPVSTIWQWCVSRSNSAVVIFASPNTLGHSAKLKFVVIATLVCS